MRSYLPADRDTFVFGLALAFALTLWGALLVILLFDANRLYSLSMLALTGLPLAIYTSRNPRLFCLVGAVFSAGLGLSINFRQIALIGGAPSYSIDLVDVFLLPLLVYLARDFIFGMRREIRLPALSLWWLGLIALGVMSLVLGPQRQLAAFEVVRMLKCWVLFLVIVNECVRERHFRYVALALALGVALNIAAALAQYALKHDLGLQALGEPSVDAITGANFGVYLSSGSVYRVGGLMGHPNLLAAYLAMLLPIFVALLFTPLSLRIKLWFTAIIGGGTLALVLTLSRAGWAEFALGMTLLLIALFYHPFLSQRYALLKGGMLAVMTAASVVASGMIVRRITQSDPGAFDFREQWVDIAWKMVRDKPFFGFGLNSFSHSVLNYVPYDVSTMIERFGHVWPVVHNIYMLVWAEQGTLGLLLFLGLQAHVLWIGVRNLRVAYSRLIFMIVVGAVCGFLAVMLDGFASFFIRVPASGRMYWIVIGLIVAADYWNRLNAPLRAQSAERATQPAALATTMSCT
jgi:O-antigen ligase